VVLSTLLAFAAAVAFAFATVAQQATARAASLRSTRDSPVRARPHPRRPVPDEGGPAEGRAAGRHRRAVAWLPVLGLLGQLARHPVWLLGWVLNAVGFAAHAAALHLGAIGVVQAILVAQLPCALLIRARWWKVRPTGRDWFAVACVATGLALLVLLRGDEPQHAASRGAVALCVGLAACVVLVVLAVARRLRRHAQVRAAVVAGGAGLCFVVSAVLIVVITGDIAHSGLAEVVDWPVVCVAVSSVTGMLLVQDAFASGSLPTALTTSTIADPVLAGIVGTVLFSAVPPSGLALVLGLPAVAALVVTGVVLIARSPTLHVEPAAARGHAVASASDGSGSRPRSERSSA
jgi:drug/metabolite transporter (DMT)-like permease